MVAQRDYSGMADEALFSAYQEGDNLAFERLVNTYRHGLVSYLRKKVGESTEDCIQDTFLMIHQNNLSFDPSKESLRNWIYTLARNIAITRLRKKEVRKHMKTCNWGENLIGIEDRKSQNLFNPRYPLSQRRDFGRLESYIERIPEKNREILNLMYGRGNSIEKIGKIMGIPQGTIKSRLNTSLVLLRKKQKDIFMKS